MAHRCSVRCFEKICPTKKPRTLIFFTLNVNWMMNQTCTISIHQKLVVWGSRSPQKWRQGSATFSASKVFLKPRDPEGTFGKKSQSTRGKIGRTTKKQNKSKVEPPSFFLLFLGLKVRDYVCFFFLVFWRHPSCSGITGSDP